MAHTIASHWMDVIGDITILPNQKCNDNVCDLHQAIAWDKNWKINK